MSLRTDLETLINRHSRENASGTPDFILAEYLLAQLASVEATIKARDAWWGFTPHLGGLVRAYDPTPEAELLDGVPVLSPRAPEDLTE